MSELERLEWDRRYSEGEHMPKASASSYLEEWLPRIPLGRGLDVACGTGRNALRMAEAGFQVDGVDISVSAIEIARREAERRGLEVSWRAGDLDTLELERGAFSLVTIFRYVNRGLWSRLIESLAPDGWILIEGHLATTRQVGGPSDPHFRLPPQELLTDFSALRIVSYGESIENEGETLYAFARLAACRGNPGW